MVNAIANPFENPAFRKIITEFEIATYDRKGAEDAIMFSVLQKMKYKYGVLEKRKIELMEGMGSLWTWEYNRREQHVVKFLEETAERCKQRDIVNLQQLLKNLEKAEEKLHALEQTPPISEGRTIYVG